ncbi:FUSC family protein [Streptomyces sp. 8N616]|uniref:FUSC family protein n=1 Tax=Streptomyces sp. 8N616 TaxID=3457414 RepID=UPI003FD33FAF
MLDRLCRNLPNRRNLVPEAELIAKATVGAACAWWLARLLPGHDQPYFAALAALLGVYPTVLRSLRQAIRFACGFLLGVLVSVPVSLLLGPTGWSILVVVPAALLIAAWPRLDEQGIQVPFTAVFVLLAGGSEPVAYAVPRLADVGIGVALGLLVNTALPPAPHRREPGAAAHRLSRRTADLLRDTAEEVRQGELFGTDHRNERSHAVHRSVVRVADAQATAVESHRFNLRTRLSRHRRDRPADATLDALYAAAEQARVLTRETRRSGAGTDPSLLHDGFREQFGDLLDLLAELVVGSGTSGDTPPEGRLEEAQRRYRSLRQTALDAADGGGDPHRCLAETQLCALVLQLLFDLTPARGGDGDAGRARTGARTGSLLRVPTSGARER